MNLVNTIRSSKRTTTTPVSASHTRLTSRNVLDCKGSRKSNHRTTIIVATTVGASVLLIIVLIVLVKLKRRKQLSKLSTPVEIPLQAVETSPDILPTDQEPYETVAGGYEDVAIKEANASAAGPLVESSSGIGTSEYETPDQNKEPQTSPHYPPIYTELDKNRRRNSEDDDHYQKLLKRNSDYVIPAHARRGSYEDIKMGRNLPGYTELDQMKRETEESQYSPYQKMT